MSQRIPAPFLAELRAQGGQPEPLGTNTAASPDSAGTCDSRPEVVWAFRCPACGGLWDGHNCVHCGRQERDDTGTLGPTGDLDYPEDIDDGPMDEPPCIREAVLRRLDEPYPGFFDFIGDIDGDIGDAGLAGFDDWSRGINELYGEHCADPAASRA